MFSEFARHTTSINSTRTFKTQNFSMRSELTNKSLETGNTLCIMCSVMRWKCSVYKQTSHSPLDECGADIDQRTDSGYTPLMCAAFFRKIGNSEKAGRAQCSSQRAFQHDCYNRWL